MIEFPYSTRALKIEQPLGVYYVVILPAELLLQVAFSDVLSARYVEGKQAYILDGTQRLPQPKRLEPIADYVNRVDSAFPNAIILAANYRQADGRIDDMEFELAEEEDSAVEGVAGTANDRQWSVEEADDGCHTLTIPTGEKLAAIIDGQHRLFAFASAVADRRSMPLICSVFLDLPKPYQAQLFATINSTQKPVDKSLTYELFGYNIAEEEEDHWSPDKLSVFLARRLNTDDSSPLKGRIRIAPKKDEVLQKLGEGRSWKVSTAVVVEGVMRLFTNNPKKDTSHLLGESRKKRSALSSFRKDKSPLRDAYLSGNDLVIYTMVLNFLQACDQVFWKAPKTGSFITKTVGVQALFDILRMKLAKLAYEKKSIAVKDFVGWLSPAADIDFSDEQFRNASGSGRTAIRKAIEASTGL